MPTRFTFQDFAKAFALSILIFSGFTLLFLWFPGANQVLEEFHPSFGFGVQYLMQFIILFFPLWFFVISKYGATTQDFALVPVAKWKAFKAVLLGYWMYLLLSVGLSLLLSSLNLHVPGYEAQESYLPFFGTDTVGLIIAFITIVIVAPILEEFYFRGFVYRVFTKTWPTWLGSILTAFLFAFIHLQPASFIPLMFLGLIINFTYERTGSLWTPITFHVFNNLIAFGVQVYLYFHPEITETLSSAVHVFYV